MIKIPHSIEKIIRNDGVTDIFFNGTKIHYYQNGVTKAIDSIDYNNMQMFVNAIASADSKEIHKRKPILESFIITPSGDYLRIEVVSPPVSNKITFSIRIPSKKIYPVKTYLNSEQLNIVEKVIKNNGNIVIAGSTGSGKTSLFKSILNEFFAKQKTRVLFIEDTPEVTNINPISEIYRTSLEVDLNKLILVALRSMPNQIMIGEIRGKEAYELIKAWNTGHNGITTLHANTIDTITLRINTMMNEIHHNDFTNEIENIINLYIYIEKINNKFKTTIKQLGKTNE